MRHIVTKSLAHGIAIALPAFLLAACTVGPDYHGAPTVVSPEHAFLRGISTGEKSADPAWWMRLGDPELDRLEAAALSQSPDLEAARARLRSSRADLRSQQANLRPSTGTNFSYLHSHTGPGLFEGLLGDRASGQSLGPSDLDLYSLGFDASWEIDLFGAKRRAAESTAATTGARLADLADAQVSLTSEVARRYVDLREAQTRRTISLKIATDYDRMCAVESQRVHGGTASRFDLARLRQSAAKARAALEPLNARREEMLDRLAILTGRLPGDLDHELAADAPIPAPPRHVFIPSPADVIRHRPDIRVAERQLAATNARIGQHVADYFPKIQLIGDLGFASTDINQLLNGNALLGIVAPVLSWKPFDFGRTGAAVAGARADHDEAIATYRRAVLEGLDDVENGLSRYAHQEETVRDQALNVAAANDASNLARQRFTGGTISLLDVLDAERQNADAQQQEVEARADLVSDYIALQKSFGLGWQP